MHVVSTTSADAPPAYDEPSASDELPVAITTERHATVHIINHTTITYQIYTTQHSLKSVCVIYFHCRQNSSNFLHIQHIPGRPGYSLLKTWIHFSPKTWIQFFKNC